jgi:hypothetical protein
MSTSMDAGELTRAPSAPAGPHGAYEDVRVLLVATLLGGAAVHAAVVREHLEHWPAAGLFFVLLAGAGLVAGMALLRRIDRPRLLAALALTVGPLLVWLVSRTAGLPFGPEAGEPEQVAWSDAAACLLALAGAGAALLLLRAAPRLWARALPAAAQRVGLVLVALVTVVGLTSAAVAEPEHVKDTPAGHVGSGHSVGVEVGEHLTRPAGESPP